MATIKIISNPYIKEVSFERLSDDTSDWEKIDSINNPNSRLLRKEITNGFFPFHVKQIVESIIEEYDTSEEHITIVFEGTADEYEDLQEVCTGDFFGTEVVIKRSIIGLENARDILPKVKMLFQKMSPLIAQSVSQEKIQHELVRFSDASSDVVPICVLGNYSTGKSTFINALIGCELLPSGAEPVTAKVYKIARSNYSDRASIKCKFLGGVIQINFTKDGTKINDDIAENELSLELSAALDSMNGESLTLRANKALSIINDMENRTEAEVISDLIEVEIPFSKGVLARSPHPFVIFDTPGSNSASNIKHLNVLKEAMASMTNGLPIFLSTPDALDSTDNENLYHFINELDELDNRFTMIVVNKADSAGIQRRNMTDQDQKRILSQAVPRLLYSGGLFYVSSILGLGAKTDGSFIDYDYEDIFEAQVARYNDQNNKHYRSLYRYNILPTQIKKRSDTLAECQTDLIYANSGLFSVETEIDTFAGKYASYNKCFQSQLFLRKVILITDEEIDRKKTQNEAIKKKILRELENDKQRLFERLVSASRNERERFSNKYQEYMSGYIAQTEGSFSPEAMKEQELVFTKSLREKLSVEDHEQAVQNAVNSVRDNLLSNLGQIFNDQKVFFGTIKATAQGFASDVGNAFDKVRVRHDTLQEVSRTVADDLMKYASAVFEEKRAEYFETLDEASKTYWTASTEEIRTILAHIVSGEVVLTDDRRSELESIIITYKQVSFDETIKDNIFNKEDFEQKIKFFNIVLWQSDHLNTDKLAEECNKRMARCMADLCDAIGTSHKESAKNWIENLLGEIQQNIVKYNPELSKQQQQVEMLTERINELISYKAQLGKYSDELISMMNWRVV